MGIDYVIDLPCAPKEALGVDVLVSLVKAKSRAAMVLRLARDGGDHRPPDQLTFTTVLETPEGVEEQQVSVQQLIDQAAPLDAQRAHCASCPVNGDAEAFGCYRSISYPVREAAEAWLLGRLPEDLDSTAGRFLTRAIADFGWNGAHAAEMRGQGDTIFESDEALAVRWGEPGGGDDGDDDDGFQVDTDQVFEMLFHVGPISPAHATMLALFFGVLPHDLDLAVLGSDDTCRRALAAATVPREADEAIEPLAGFLRALAQAAAHDVHVLIDG